MDSRAQRRVKVRKSEIRSLRALRDWESRSRKGGSMAVGGMRMVVFAGRAFAAEDRRRRMWVWRRRRERAVRAVDVARVLYWVMERRESVPVGVERMRERWERVASGFFI